MKKRMFYLMMAMVITLAPINIVNAAELDDVTETVGECELTETISDIEEATEQVNEADDVLLETVEEDDEKIEAEEPNETSNGEENTVELDLSTLEPEDLPIEYIEESKFGCRVKTTSGNLNIRSGPGTNYPIIGKAANGSVVDVSIFGDVKGEWWEVGAKDVQTGKWINGWVNSRYLEYIPGSGE